MVVDVVRWVAGIIRNPGNIHGLLTIMRRSLECGSKTAAAARLVAVARGEAADKLGQNGREFFYPGLPRIRCTAGKKLDSRCGLRDNPGISG